MSNSVIPAGNLKPLLKAALTVLGTMFLLLGCRQLFGGRDTGDLSSDTDAPAPDILAANFGQENRVYLGNGPGGFTSVTDASADTNNSYDVALGDINGDSHLDTFTTPWLWITRHCRRTRRMNASIVYGNGL